VTTQSSFSSVPSAEGFSAPRLVSADKGGLVNQAKFRVDSTQVNHTVLYINRNDVVNMLTAALLMDDENMRNAVQGLVDYTNSLKAV
jgi:hypothetical protein